MEKMTCSNILRTLSIQSKILFIVLFFSVVIIQAQEKDYKRYNEKSGIIEYKVSGEQNGTETIYFDNYGMKEAKYSDIIIEMFGIKQKDKKAVYLDGYWQYTIDLLKNAGTKREDDMLKQLVESSDEELVDIGMKMFISMGGEKIGQETFLGKACDVWQIESMGSRILIWNYIPLKTVVDMMGMKITYEATSIKINVDIPDDKIDIPENIEYKEFDLDQFQNLMEGL